jgi:uncharacterized protein (TIGR01777 family)
LIVKKRIILAGGTGFIGRTLAPVLLTNGYEPVVLTRGIAHENKGIRFLQWNCRDIDNWAELVDGAKAVLNLAGKSVNCRDTTANRREIIDSRVNSVHVLAQAIAQCSDPPEAFVQASSLAIYGDTGDRWCNEDAPQGEDFGADVCRVWEKAFAEIDAQSMRKSVFRIGFAIGPNGGVLEFLTGLTRWFLGGRVGNGRQFVSWIHVSDLNRMFLWAIERSEIEGVFNVCTPNPVTNGVLMRDLRHALHRPWSPPVPTWLSKIGAWIMGTDAKLALTGRRCRPQHFLEKGFEFEFPELRVALADIFHPRVNELGKR